MMTHKPNEFVVGGCVTEERWRGMEGVMDY